MKKFFHISALCISLVLSGVASAAHVDLTVENESSERIYVYQHTGGKYEHMKTVKAGESWVEHTETGENWAVADPKTNKIIKALNVSRFARTLHIDDQDLGVAPRSGSPDRNRDNGASPINIRFTNTTKTDMDIYALEGLRYKYKGSIRSRKSAPVSFKPGQRWRAQSAKTGNILDDGIAPNRSRDIDLDNDSVQKPDNDRHQNDGRNDHERDSDRDHNHDSNEQKPKESGPIAVTIVNRSGEEVAIYKEITGRRSSYHSTLPADRSTLIETSAGTVWTIIDPESQSIIRKLEVPDKDGTLTIYPEQGAPHDTPADQAGSDEDLPAPVRLLKKIFGR
jgi:hypothetical protein